MRSQFPIRSPTGTFYAGISTRLLVFGGGGWVIKVVHLITSLSTGGAETMLFRLLGGMDRDKFSNMAISVTDEGTLGGQIREMGIPVHALHMRRGMPNPAGLWRLVRILRRERPVILQTWLYHSDLIGLVAARATRVPHVVWNIRCSETDERYTTGLTGIVLRLLARFSRSPDAVVVNSEAGQRSHENLGYHPRRWEVIPNGIDIEAFRPDPGASGTVRAELQIGPDCPLIGLVARYDPLKDHRTFIDATAEFLRAGGDAHFVLAGYGVDNANEALAKRIRELGIADRVHLLGERDDISRLNAAFDVATCSSTGEGFPNVLAEAMACGTPCVSTDVGDARALIGDTGLLVPKENPSALAQAWRVLADAGPGKRNDLGGAARARITHCYDLRSITQRYEAFYEGLMTSSA